jgi:hypothetical protein
MRENQRAVRLPPAVTRIVPISRWPSAICGIRQVQTTKPFLKRWTPTQTGRPAVRALHVTCPVRSRWCVRESEMVSRPVKRRPARGRWPHWSNVLVSSSGGRRRSRVREILLAGTGAAAVVAAVRVGGGAGGGADGFGAGEGGLADGAGALGAEVRGLCVGGGGLGAAAGGLGAAGEAGGGGVGGGGAGGGVGGVGGEPLSATVPNACTHERRPLAAAATPTPIARKDERSMLPLCPGELSQPCITEAADG